MNSIELFETPDWKRLEAYEAEIESAITESTLEDYLYKKALIKQFGRNLQEGKLLNLTELLINHCSSMLSNNEHWEYTQRHRSAIFTAFKNGGLIQGWILHDDYPEFLAAITKKRKIRTGLTKNGQGGYYQVIQ
jgi:hypothetical protein